MHFDSWPVDKYGTLESTLSDFYEVNIDPKSALIPLREGQSDYLAKVEMPSWFIDPDHHKRMLRGGMTINADIVINRKPLINMLIARWSGSASALLNKRKLLLCNPLCLALAWLFLAARHRAARFDVTDRPPGPSSAARLAVRLSAATPGPYSGSRWPAYRWPPVAPSAAGYSGSD